MKTSTSSNKASKFKAAAVAIFGACIAIAAILLAANIRNVPEKNVKAEAAAPVSTSSASSKVEQPAIVTAPAWHFYNLDLQENEDVLDDWNFGPNPMADVVVSSEAIASAIKSGNTTINLNEIIAGLKAEDLDKNFRERLRNDPILGTADMAWFDSILGTDYLGVFYSECGEKWDAAMNAAAKKWREDKADYEATLDAFEKYLDRATKVELKYVASGLDDQMYMNPATKDGVPEIIVMETLNHDGWFLTYTFTIKNTTVKEVAYRIDCGYQPTNVAEIMQITAIPRPKTGGGGDTPKPVPKPDPIPEPDPGTPPEPEPDPDPEPEPDPELPNPKDPTKGTPVLPNDDPGPGPDTNNGEGAQYSTKDLPTNSNHMKPEQYQKEIQDLKDANATTRKGGDSNKPSTPPPDTGTKVDSNAEEGTGYGGIDEPTPVQDSSVADDQAGDSWDGPPL